MCKFKKISINLLNKQKILSSQGSKVALLGFKTFIWGLVYYIAYQIIPTTARIQTNKRVYLSNFQQPYPNIIKRLTRPLIAIYGWLATYIKTEVLLLLLSAARTLKEYAIKTIDTNNEKREKCFLAEYI